MRIQFTLRTLTIAVTFAGLIVALGVYQSRHARMLSEIGKLQDENEKYRVMLAVCRIQRNGARLATPFAVIIDEAWQGGRNGFRDLALLPALTDLVLDRSPIRDEELAYIVRNAESLRTIKLNETEITDASVEPLLKTSYIHRLEIRRTKISDAGKAKLQQAFPNINLVD